MSLKRNLLGAAAGVSVFLGGLLIADSIAGKYLNETLEQIAVTATAIPIVIATGYAMEKVSPRQRIDNYGQG